MNESDGGRTDARSSSRITIPVGLRFIISIPTVQKWRRVERKTRNCVQIAANTKGDTRDYFLFFDFFNDEWVESKIPI